MTNQQEVPEALANFDAAVAAMLQCVGTVPCNSHEICTGFAANTRKRLAALLEAQQPAPSAAAAKQSAACDKAPAGWLCIRQHGHDGPCAAEPTLSARSDEWIEGYAAGVRDGRADALRAPQPSPMPQADSQPTPHSEPWYGHQFKEVRRGYWQCSCGKAIAEAVPSASKDSYPPLPNRYAYDNDGGEMFTADHMRAYVDSDRAARAPADSVLEDAARLDWLALAGPTSICLVIDRPHDGEVEVATDDVTGYGKTLREAIDAAMNKGGA